MYDKLTRDDAVDSPPSLEAGILEVHCQVVQSVVYVFLPTVSNKQLSDVTSRPVVGIIIHHYSILRYTDILYEVRSWMCKLMIRRLDLGAILESKVSEKKAAREEETSTAADSW